MFLWSCGRERSPGSAGALAGALQLQLRALKEPALNNRFSIKLAAFAFRKPLWSVCSHLNARFAILTLNCMEAVESDCYSSGGVGEAAARCQCYEDVSIQFCVFFIR
jgi:hypothetical protein